MTGPDRPWEEWTVRTSYLRHPVYDLEDLVRRPRHYGIDLVGQPDEARAYIRGIQAHERLWAEGFIELSIGGVELLYPRLWDYVHVLWHTLVQLGADLIAEGSAFQTFPDQEIPLELTALPDGRMVRFGVGDASVTVDRRNFLRQLAEHGEWYYQWYDAATGETSSVELDKVTLIREAAGERR